MNIPEQKVFFVGDWRVSPAEGVLTRAGEVVHLEPKVAEVLVYLASRAGEVVTRDELERAVWHGAVVGYDAVTSTVIKLRRALRDDPRQPRFIATIPKRGYELIAVVRFPEPGQRPTSSAAVAQESPRSEAMPRPPTSVRRKRVLIFALLGGLIVGAAALWVWASFTSTSGSSPSAVLPAILVLPFENMSNDPQQDYLTDGMTEDLTTDLSRASGLRVLANNISFAYRGKHVSPQEVGKTLHVDFVLQGSIRLLGDAIRVNAQLVDAKTGFNKWGETYDRTKAQVFAVQHEITTGVVEALAVALTDEEKQRLARKATSNLKAYDYFQEGQRLSKVRTREANERAQEAYRKAIEIDPTYGRAYGALAYTMGVDFQRGWTDNPVETLDRALDLAENAVALDDSTPQTHWSLGYVQLLRREYDSAMQAATKAVGIAPNYADGYGLLALVSNNRGDPERAIEYVKKGMQLNPFYTWDYPFNLGRAYYALGNYRKAITALEAARERNPNVMFVNLFLVASYVRAGRLQDAEWIVQELQTMSPPATITHVKKMMPIANQEEMNTLLSDLRKAGLPE